MQCPLERGVPYSDQVLTRTIMRARYINDTSQLYKEAAVRHLHAALGDLLGRGGDCPEDNLRAEVLIDLLAGCFTDKQT